MLLLSFSNYKGMAQTWIQLPNLPFQTVLDTFISVRYGCGFVIGSNIYYLPPDTSRLWSYNTVTAIWSRKAVFPPGTRSNAAGFAIDPYGYVTCGRSYGTTPGQMLDLWQYNPSTDTWTQKSNIATFTREHCVSFVVNGKAYVGGGTSTAAPTLTPYLSSMREYNPTSDTWTNKAAIPDVNNPPFATNGRGFATAFAFGAYGYISNGIGNGSLLTDTRQYNPNTNTWASVSTPFGSIVGGTGISQNNKGFLCFGQAGVGQTTFNTIWQLDSTLVWTPKSNFTGLTRKFTLGFTVGCNAYILGGLNYNSSNTPANTPLVDFWKSECNTLPISLLDFQSVCSLDDFQNVKVTWRTASESNSKSFIVRIILDDKVYENEVPANGNSNQIVKYAANFSFAAGIGLNQAIISLVELDLDGKYTKVLEQYLNCNAKSQVEISVYPNPSATGIFFIKGIFVDPKLLKVVDALGREVHFVYSIYEDIMTLKLGERCQAGIYYLKYKDYSYKISLQY
jgi:N-acetylneuraminic acid mutarotase